MLGQFGSNSTIHINECAIAAQSVSDKKGLVPFYFLYISTILFFIYKDTSLFEIKGTYCFKQ